jgi:hypothetical protein
MQKITQLTLALIISISQSCCGSFIEATAKKIVYSIADAKFAPRISIAEEKPLLLPLLNASKEASFNYAWQKVFHASSKQHSSLLDLFIGMTIARYIQTVTQDQLKQSALPHQVADLAWEKLELNVPGGIFNLLNKSHVPANIEAEYLETIKQEFAAPIKSTAVKHGIPLCASLAGAIGSYYIVKPLLKKLLALGQKNRYVRYAVYAYCLHEIVCLANIISKTTKNPANGTYRFPQARKPLTVSTYLQLITAASTLYKKIQS